MMRDIPLYPPHPDFVLVDPNLLFGKDNSFQSLHRSKTFG